MIDHTRASFPLFARPRRRVLLLWALMALVNLSAGMVLAFIPERASDLETMHRWGREWLVEGLDVYAPADSGADYPPHAIVALAPLGVVPMRWLIPSWTAVNIGLAVLAPYLAARVVRPDVTLTSAALPILMFLCWGGARTLLQFSLLTLTLGLLAMVLADRRALGSGICLGLALMKPQLGAAFFLWALFTRRLFIAVVSALVVSLGLGVFCLRARASPLSVVLRYADILRMFHTGDAPLVGLTNLGPLVALMVSNPAVADILSAAIALLLLGAICILGFREGKNREAVIYTAPALVGLWSLLTFYHLTYGFVVMLPTAALLIFAGGPHTLTERKVMVSVLQLGLMVDVPGVWRRIGHLFASAEIMGALLPHFDRLLVLVTFGSVVWLLRREKTLTR